MAQLPYFAFLREPVAVTGCAFVGADLKWPTADVVT
jgi:hypothetical protein